MTERDLIRILLDAPNEEFRLRLRSDLAAAAASRHQRVEGEEMQTTMTYVREGMHTINPYLVVRGAGRLLEFVKIAFGGRERLRVPLPDGSVMHAEIQVGDSTIEMGDSNPQYPPVDMSLHVYVPDADATYQRALAAGATSIEEPVDQPYGDREAGVKDQSGNTWWIATHKGESHIPEHLREVTIGLRVLGAAGLVDFMERAFGARRIGVHSAPDGSIGHAKIGIGDSVLEVSEAHGQFGPVKANIHLYVPDTDAAYEQALAAGATSQRPPTTAPYGDRAAGVVDPWGNQWWLATFQGERPI